MAENDVDLSAQLLQTLDRVIEQEATTNGHDNASSSTISGGNITADTTVADNDSEERAAKRVKLDNLVENVPKVESRKVKGVALIKPE